MRGVLAALEHVIVDAPLEAGGSVRALDGISLSVAAGEAVAVMGASGAGKSTLALVLAGLTAPTAGRVLHAGGDGSRPAASLVLQRAERALFGETVREDVGFALEWAGADAAVVADSVRDAIAAVSLDDGVLDESPFALSGGEQRRVAIAGVLAARPRLLILDEPAAGLDAGARAAVHDAVRRLVSGGTGVVVVSHDPEDAALCGRLVVLAEGRVAYDGPTADVLSLPRRAADLGLAVAPAVWLAHAVAGGTPGEPEPPRTLDEGELLTYVAARARPGRPSPSASGTGPSKAHLPEGWLLSTLAARPRPFDARARILAFCLFIAAVFMASSLAGSLLVLAGGVGAVLWSRTPARAIAAALLPFGVVLAAIAAVQLLFGAAPEVTLYAGRVVRSDAAFVAHRMTQLIGVIVGSLALTHGSDAVTLADGLRWLLAPLRLLRLPVEQLSLVLAIGLASVPAMASDIRAVELAQSARIGRSTGTALARLRLRAALLVPLLVHALRRARHLGDALHVRGYRPGMQRHSWRPMPPRAADLLPVLGAAGLVALAVVV